MSVIRVRNQHPPVSRIISQQVETGNNTNYSTHVPPVPLQSGNSPRTQLALSDDPAGPFITAQWIGHLVALGSRVWRRLPQLSSEQLVVVITVPRRDFAATLVGCGWVMAHPAPTLSPPLDVLKQLKPGDPVRLVTGSQIVAGEFRFLQVDGASPRVFLNVGDARKKIERGWLLKMISAATALPELEKRELAELPHVGSVGKYARLDVGWRARLATPAADLAIVGTRAWLRQDASAYLSAGVSDCGDPSLLSTLLLARDMQPATWSTRLYPSAGFADRLPLPSGVQAVILDGAAAIKYLPQIEVPVVVCIIDRSIADETASEVILQQRNMGSTPVSLASLSWHSAPGIEALAFTVAL